MRMDRNSFVLAANDEMGGGGAADRGVGRQGCLLLLFPGYVEVFFVARGSEICRAVVGVGISTCY